MNIMKYKHLYLLVTILVILSCIGLWTVKGFNYGVDFTGGTNIRFPLKEKVTSPEVKEVLESEEFQEMDLKMTPPQPYDYIDSQGKQRYGVLIHTRFMNNEEQKKVLSALEARFGLAEEEAGLDIYSVDPLIGRELVANALKAVTVACLLIMIYIAFRFEFKSGVTGLLALIFDTSTIIGLFVLLQKEIDATFIAALLTIIGYSINDTIVIFDRIRENLRFRKKGQTFEELANLSIMQSMKRSLNTSITTVLAILVLYLVGSPSIKTFCFALIIGLTSGTLSSLFIAGPLWAMWKGFEEKREMSRKVSMAGNK